MTFCLQVLYIKMVRDSQHTRLPTTYVADFNKNVCSTILFEMFDG